MTPTQGEHAQTAAVLRNRLSRIHAACSSTQPKQAVGEMIAAMLDMPEWAALTAAPAQPAAPQGVAYAELEKKHRDFVETVSLMLDAIGYKEDYARQWPKEKASITFKRWFDEQRASNGQAPAGAAVPTDEQILDLAGKYWVNLDETERLTEIALVRDALAKWGAEPLQTPTAQAAPAAGAVAGPGTDEVLAAARNWGDVEPYLCRSGSGEQKHRIVFHVHERAAHFAKELFAAAPTPAAPADSVLEDAARWFSERDNVLHSFWVLLGEAETQADNDNNPLLKHQVEGFYRQWNALNGSALEPRWVTRAARKQGAKHD